MNSEYSLAPILGDILSVVYPTDDDWSRRFQIINDLRAVVESLEILRGATVEPFGSFVSNLFTRWGDLDISIELPNGLYISAAGKKYKQALLSDVQRALRRQGGFHGLKFISHARVPILKCDSNKANISCDISINNLSGQMKSKLLFWINEIDGRFRDMVLLVKEWAKAHGINDPKSGTLNSYSLSLLVIFHFQTCEPAILPPLSEIYPGNMVDDLIGVRAAAEKNIEDVCALNINRIKSDKSRKINRSSLAELFISFLAKFCDISSRATTQGISPFNGQWEDIDRNMIWQPKTYALFIEDPFEQPLNCARAVSQRNLLKIAEAFQSSHQKLTSPNQNHPITLLVRPEVLSIMSGSPPVLSFSRIYPQLHRNPVSNGRGPPGIHLQPFRNPSNNGTEHHNRNGGGSQVHRAGRAPAQGQQYQFQSNPLNGINLRPGHASQSQTLQFHESPNNVVSQRPGKASQGQAQRFQGNPNNGVNQRSGQASESQTQQFQRYPNNGVNPRPGHLPQGQVQQKWRPRSEK